MTKADKIFRSWLTKPPTDAPIEKVKAFIKKNFDENWRWEGGSHIVVEDERLIGHDLAGPAGDFSVPVKSGKRVKGFYLKRLAILAKYLKDLENEEGL